MSFKTQNKLNSDRKLRMKIDARCDDEPMSSTAAWYAARRMSRKRVEKAVAQTVTQNPTRQQPNAVGSVAILHCVENNVYLCTVDIDKQTEQIKGIYHEVANSFRNGAAVNDSFAAALIRTEVLERIAELGLTDELRYTFPGGSQDPAKDADLLATVEREVFEEASLHSEDIEFTFRSFVPYYNDPDKCQAVYTAKISLDMLTEASPGVEQLVLEIFTAEEINDLIQRRKMPPNHANYWRSEGAHV